MSASLTLGVGPNGKTPALLTRMSTWPPPSSMASRASARTDLASARSAAMKSALPPAARMAATAAPLRVAPTDQHVGPPAGQQVSGGAADAAGRSGHQGGGAGEIGGCHVVPLRRVVFYLHCR